MALPLEQSTDRGMNSSTKASSDAAGWLLELAIRLLPARRGEWGRAMQAELDHLDEAVARRRFAVGCLRVAISRPPMIRAILLVAVSLAVLSVAMVWASGIADPGVRTEAIVLVTILALAADWGSGSTGWDRWEKGAQRIGCAGWGTQRSGYLRCPSSAATDSLLVNRTLIREAGGSRR
jgi:hypothetical protein